MAIRLSCGACGTEMTAQDEYAGTAVHCPRCSSIVPVPHFAIDSSVFESPPLLQILPKKRPRKSNSLVWIGAVWGALLVVLIAGARFYLSAGPEEPKPTKTVRVPHDPHPTPPPIQVERPIKITAKSLIRSTANDRNLIGKQLEVTTAIVQGWLRRDGKVLVLISEPGKKFVATDSGGRISCYGAADALRVNDVHPGQSVVIRGRFVGRVSDGQDFDRTELGNANLLDCEVVSLGAIPQPTVDEPPPVVQVPLGPILLPIPADDVFKRKEQALHEIEPYRKQFDSRNPEDWLALATELYDLARKEPDSDARYCEYRIAMDLATRAGSFQYAYGIAKDMASQYQCDPIATKRPIVDMATQFGDAKQAVELALMLAEEAQALGQLEAMKELLATAIALAKSPALIKQAKEVSDYLNNLTILVSVPDDPDANLIVGRFLCFQRQEWTTGIKRLRKCSNPLLKRLAGLEVDPTDPHEQFVLGSEWWDHQVDVDEPDKSYFKSRALDWYRSAVKRLPKDSLDYKVAMGRIEPPVQPPPPKPKSRMANEFEWFFFAEMQRIGDIVAKETTAVKKQTRHEEEMRALDRALTSKAWALRCEIIEVQEVSDGGEILYKISFKQPEDLPMLSPGTWKTRTSVTILLDSNKARAIKAGDFLLFNSTPRLAYFYRQGSDKTDHFGGPWPSVSEANNFNFFSRADKVGDRSGTLILGLINLGKPSIQPQPRRD